MNLLGAIVSAAAPSVGKYLGGDVGQSIGQGVSNYMETEAAHDWQMDLLNTQHQWAIEDWERMNEYNIPLNQMKRLEEAGLNPLLADTTGGLSPSPSTAPSVPSSELSAMAAMRSTINQEQLLQSQIENLEADTKLKNEKSITESETRDLVKGMMQSGIDLNDSNVKLNTKKTELTDEEINEVKAATDKLTQETNNLSKMFDILEQDLLLKQKEVNWYDKRVEQELRESASRIGLNGAQASQAVAYAQLLGEQYETQRQITKGQKLSNGIQAINFRIADKTKHAKIQIEVAKGKKSQVYIDTPEWSKDVNGFVNELSPGMQLFMNYIKLGQSFVPSETLP